MSTPTLFKSNTLKVKILFNPGYFQVDIFKEKIQTIHIKDHFPEFNGFSRDYESGIQFIESMYVPDKRERERDRLRNKIYPHQTCATDTNQMRAIFDRVKDTIFRMNMRATGLGDF